MVYTTLLLIILFNYQFFQSFEKKQLFTLFKIATLNLIISFKYYTMFVGIPTFKQLPHLLFGADEKLLIASLVAAAQIYFLFYLYYRLREKKVFVPRYQENLKLNTLRIQIILKKFISGVAAFLITLSFLFLFACNWAISYFGKVDINQILFTLSQPLEGSGSEQIENFVFSPLLNSILCSVLVWLVVNHLIQFKIKWKNSEEKPSLKIWKYLLFPASIVIFATNLYLGLSVFGIKEIRAALFENTEFYESYYKNPAEVEITFPEKKRNLVYIYLESMESSYLSQDLGGVKKENLLPNLAELAQENTHFSNTEKLGGALPLSGVNYTVGAMVAQTSGIPLKTSLNQDVPEQKAGNNYGENIEAFLPGVYSLGEVLAEEGYQQQLFIGSYARFASRDKYFKQHGEYQIMDYPYAHANQWIPSDHYVWWGYEDEILFELAKEQIVKTAASGEPFNFTLLTADTHFPDGYMTENTPEIFDDQYSNVIHYADEMVADFITFLQAQPFYENTTIIICGDHITMDQTFAASVPDDYQRTVYNCIINSPVEASKTQNRQFSALDLYPTTLAALGAQIEGERLGLGTNLFSKQPTLIEQLGYDTLDLELQKKSTFYDDVLLGKKREEPTDEKKQAEK
ncbi:phosphoglycerol transferase [Enterococcus sp. PF1-24]|uniref:LTA synthase family protein n=1 Tax=unclassified Enterococcus TaxID=2608891 RepID=UPI0024730F06|nr:MULTISPECIES: LTA synthase family protein [unclassified Enterococcus]MDH6364558.1 phosphoglycerol transferase [Enterococcus sp. PFB1-1]MDH6401659.1 phosphoglycerol transferase [Enterococcus sp. PF1-24]